MTKYKPELIDELYVITKNGVPITDSELGQENSFVWRAEAEQAIEDMPKLKTIICDTKALRIDK